MRRPGRPPVHPHPAAAIRRRRVLAAALVAAAAACALSSCWALLRHFGGIRSLLGSCPTELFGIPVGVLLSKCLSLGVVAGSLVGKLPQVKDIWNAKSGNGISVLSIWTEAASMGVQLAYNVVRGTPLTTYAEVPVLFVQLLLLAAVHAWAEGYLSRRIWLGVLSLAGASAGMALRVVPVSVTISIYAMNAVLGLMTVLPQVHMNHRQKSTGQLSIVVTFMTFSGTSTRLLTTLIEVDDVGVLASIALNWLLVGMLMAQFWTYRDKRPLPPLPASVTTMVRSPSLSHTFEMAEEVGELVKKTASKRLLMDTVSQYGSSRCLTDLVENDVVDECVTRVTSNPSFQRLRSLSRNTFSSRNFSGVLLEEE